MSDQRWMTARDARLAYEDAVTSDGVTDRAWWAIAGGLRTAVDDLTALGALPSVIESCRARAFDAEMRAQYAVRMVDLARRSRVIDMGTLVEVRS